MYLLSGLLLESDREFPELSPAQTGSAPDVHLDFLASAPQHKIELPPYHTWFLPDGPPWLFIFKEQSSLFTLRFPSFCDFIVDFDRKLITCRPVPAARNETIRHLFLNQVMPLYLSNVGRILLHAGAVRTPDGAVAFVGNSGVGKSTLTAALGEACPILTDDCLIIDQVNGTPMARGTYPGVRLWPDVIPQLFQNRTAVYDVAEYTSKKRIDTQSGRMVFEDQAVPLARLYVLDRFEPDDENSEISISKFAPTDAVVQLLKFTFVLDVDDREQSVRHLRFFQDLVRADLVRHLRFPSGFAGIPRVYKTILDDLTRAQRHHRIGSAE